MIHDTAQGQTQFNLCAELRAQVVELAKERDECRNQYFGLEGMYEDIQKERDMWRDTDLRDAARVDELAAQLAASKAQIAAYATKLGAESAQVCYLEDQVAALTKERDKYKEFFARDYEAQLAASQAREAKLREALGELSFGRFPKEGDEYSDDSMRLFARDALATIKQWKDQT